MSPLKIRNGTFCMEPKGVSSAKRRRPSGRKGSGTTAPPSRSAAATDTTMSPLGSVR